MTKEDDILYEVKSLKAKLYGENGFEGDIPYIKTMLKEVDNRSIKNRLMVYCLIVAGVGGGSFGVAKLIDIISRVG